MISLRSKVKQICLPLVMVIGIMVLVLNFQSSAPVFQLQSLGKLTNFSPVASFSRQNLHDWIPKKLQYTNVNNSQEKEMSASEKSSPKLKVTHINFLKVHKAGSTTMQNMMFRFGLRYGLNILLPPSGNYFTPWGKGAVKIPPTEHFDVFAIHTTFNPNAMKNFLPNDTVNIAIVREPIDRFISAAYYYRDIWKHKHLLKVPRQRFIHELVQHPDLYETKGYSTTKNAMGKDFGFPVNMKYNETTRIKDYINSLDKKFSLVMLVEQFDESLVLLRRLLNWSHLDIVYLKTNAHKHKPTILSPAEKTIFRKTCFMDFALYEHFKKRFEEKLKSESDDFQGEVDQFRLVLDNVKDFCDNSNDDDILEVESSRWSEQFNITVTECTLMKRKELAFIKDIRVAQYKRHNMN